MTIYELSIFVQLKFILASIKFKAPKRISKNIEASQKWNTRNIKNCLKVVPNCKNNLSLSQQSGRKLLIINLLNI